MKRTEEERRAWREKLAALAGKVRAMSEEERGELAATYGTVTAEGRPLSAFNSVFLAMQAGRPLLQVGGFRQWLKAGRAVRRGEHAAGSIWVPAWRGRDGDAGALEDAGDGDGGEHARRRFLLVPVFDVTQTEPAEPRATAAA